MKVIIDEHVHQTILEFYAISMRLHITLDEATVMAKVERLIGAMYGLGTFYYIYPEARFKKSWKEAGYREMIVEDFHIAFRIEMDEDGEQYVAIHDAIHSLLYHD